MKNKKLEYEKHYGKMYGQKMLTEQKLQVQQHLQLVIVTTIGIKAGK